MIIILALIILVGAVMAGVADVLGNSGTGHALACPFAVFGYHVTGSTGRLFLYSTVLGTLALLGLTRPLAGFPRRPSGAPGT